jgi:hypothetical protein
LKDANGMRMIVTSMINRSFFVAGAGLLRSHKRCE